MSAAISFHSLFFTLYFAAALQLFHFHADLLFAMPLRHGYCCYAIIVDILPRAMIFAIRHYGCRHYCHFAAASFHIAMPLLADMRAIYAADAPYARFRQLCCQRAMLFRCAPCADAA
jgi:hypothetical protein